MKKSCFFLCLLMAMSFSFSSCIILGGGGGTEPEQKVDYAPQNLKNGAYIQFNRPDGENIKIVFQTNNVSDNAQSSASNGRINTAYYHYDGFNMATLTYNYQPNGDVSRQYKAELDFTYSTGGRITFLDTNTTGTFTYRP